MRPDGASAALASPAILLYALWGAPLVGPALASAIVSFLVEGKAGVRSLIEGFTRWRAGVGWYAVALLMTPAIWVLVLIILATTLSHKFQPGPPQTLTGILLVPIGGALSSLLEEIGWIGIALPRLLATRRAAVAGILLGLVWAVWRIVINLWAYDFRFDGQALATYAFGVGTAFLPLVAYRVLIVWVYVNTGRSMLLGCVDTLGR